MFRRAVSENIHFLKQALLALSAVCLFAQMAPSQQAAYEANKRKATSLTAEAKQLAGAWTATSIDAAITRYVAARQIWRVLQDRREEAQVLEALGKAFLILSRFKEAQTAFSDSHTIYDQLKDSRRAAELLADIGEIHLMMGDRRQAIAVCEQALALDNSDRVKARALTIIADATHFVGDFRRASDSVSQALALWQSLNDYEGQARALNRVASLRVDTGRLDESRDIRRQSLSLWRLAQNPQGEATTLTNIGSESTFRGEYQTSLDYHGQAISIFQKIGDRKGLANALGNMGYTYFSLGEMERALYHYQKASLTYNTIGNHYFAATVGACIGDVHLANGDSLKALEQYKISLAMMERFSDRQWQALILHSIGTAQFDNGNYDEAMQAYQKAVLLFRTLPNERWEAKSLIGLGSVYLNLKDKQRARECFDRSLLLSRATSDAGAESLARYNLARMEREDGNLDNARRQIQLALEINESLRSKVVSQQSRAAYLGSVYKGYELYVDVLMLLHRQHPSQGFDARAFEATERGRARTLVEMLVEARNDIRAGVDPALLAREQLLEKQLASQTQSQLQQGGNRRNAGLEDTQKEQTTALSAEYEKVQAQIRTTSQNYAALRLPGPLTLREAQQLLDPDTTLLEFGLGDERSFVWAVTAQSVTGFTLPSRAKIETAARRVYGLLTARNESANNPRVSFQQRIVQADTEYLDAASELSAMLFAPLYHTLNCKRIIVVADGALQYIPFAALPTPQPEGRKEPGFDTASNSFAARYEVVNLPSIAVLAVQRRELANRSVPPGSVAVFGDPVFDSLDSRVLAANRRDRSMTVPKKLAETTSSLSRSLTDVGLNTSAGIPRLPFSRQEVEAIFSLSRNRDSVEVLDFMASRTNLIRMDLSRFRILHFATHGLLNNEHPELSGILLSLVDEKGKRQDGFLTLQDIYRFNLQADLVVLSACQTAIGKNIRGEGLMGLTRGFMYAGASRVVGSLWKIDDAATAALMTEFYKEMFTNGKRPAAALREAQMQISKQKRWQSPYYWAGFILQGDWR